VPLGTEDPFYTVCAPLAKHYRLILSPEFIQKYISPLQRLPLGSKPLEWRQYKFYAVQIAE